MITSLSGLVGLFFSSARPTPGPADSLSPSVVFESRSGGDMDVCITVDGETPAGLILDLESWLTGQAGEWERVRVVTGAVEQGTLGPLAEAVQLVLGSAGTISSVASVVLAWLQYRKDDVRATFTVPGQDGSAEVSARRAASGSPAARDGLIEWLEEAWRLQ